MTRTRRDGAQPLPCPKSSAPDLHFELQGLGGPPREPLLGAPGAWQRRGAGRGLGASSGGWPPQVPEERCAALGAAGAMGARGVRLALCGFALLCALGLGQRPAGRSSCGAGRLLRGTGTNARCCRSCARGKEGPGAPARRSSGAAPPPRAQRKLSGSRALPGGLKAPSSGQGPGRCAEAGKGEQRPAVLESSPDRSGVPRWRRAGSHPSGWVVSLQPSARTLPAQVEVAAPLATSSLAGTCICG